MANVAVSFVGGPKVSPRNFSDKQLCDLFTGKVTNWKELGGPDHEVVLFTREPESAVLTSVLDKVPCLKDAKDTKFVFRKTTEMKNAISVGEMGQFAIGMGPKTEFDDSMILEITNLQLGTDVGLIYHEKNASHPIVLAARDLAASKEWEKSLKKFGFAPAQTSRSVASDK